MKSQAKKKTIVLLLSVLMLALIFPVIYALPGENVPTLKIETSEQTVNAGESIAVPVTIIGNPGFSAFDMKITIPEGWSYTGDGVVKSSDDASGILVEGNPFEFNQDEGLLAFMHSVDITKDGTLFWLLLKAPDDFKSGKNEISIEVTDMTSAADQNTKNFGEQFEVAKALVRIPAALDIGDGQVNAGGTVMVPVRIKGNPGFSAFEMKVEIPTGWSYTEQGIATQVPGMEPGILINTITPGFNDGLIAYASGDDIEDDGTLFWLGLKAPEDAVAGEKTIEIEVTEMTSVKDKNTGNFSALFAIATGKVTVTTSTLHSITVNPSDNGRLVVTPNGNVAEGETVTITAIPDKNYKLAKLYYTDAGGNIIEILYQEENDSPNLSQLP